MIENIFWIIDNIDRIKVLPSAFKHGVSEEDMRYTVKHYYDWMFLDEDPDKVMFIGYDTALRDLEVVVAELTDGDFSIIHAMKIRPSTVNKIEEWKHEI